MNTTEHLRSLPSIYRDPSLDGKGITLFKNEIERIVDKAARLAQEVLPESYSGPSTIYVERDVHYIPVYHNYYYAPWYDCSCVPHYNVINICEPKSKKNDEDLTRFLIGLAFSATMVATAYFVAKDWSLVSETTGDLDQVLEDKHVKLLRYVENVVDHPHLNKIKDIVNIEERILKRMKNDAVTGLALKVGLFASSAVGLAGAIVASGPLMIGGAVAAVGTGCGLLFKAGFGDASKKNRRDAEEILRQVDDLKQISEDQRLPVEVEATAT